MIWENLLNLDRWYKSTKFIPGLPRMWALSLVSLEPLKMLLATDKRKKSRENDAQISKSLGVVIFGYLLGYGYLSFRGI